MSEVSPLLSYRRAHKITRAELAERLGVQRMTLYRWEMGSRSIGKDSLPRVSEVTGIPKDQLRPDLAALFKEDAA